MANPIKTGPVSVFKTGQGAWGVSKKAIRINKGSSKSIKSKGTK